MNIAILTPVRDRAWCLPEFLSHIQKAAERSRFDGNSIRFYFLENDSEDGSFDILKRFVKETDFHGRLAKFDFGYPHYRVPAEELRRRKEEGLPGNFSANKGELAILRNKLVEMALKDFPGVEALLFWDSDILLPLAALSSDPQSLTSMMRAHPNIGTLAADVQHPGCDGKFHNGMLEGRQPGTYLHPTRRERGVPRGTIPPDRLIDYWIPSGTTSVRPNKALPINWDIPSDGGVYLARVDSTGGGGATLTRALFFRKPFGFRYGPHVQGEDIDLCESIRETERVPGEMYYCGLYSGIRGLHLERDLLPLTAKISPYGEWIEDYKGRID